ncbi:hypothetical protein ACLOJK_032605 [Asimina triloba]
MQKNDVPVPVSLPMQKSNVPIPASPFIWGPLLLIIIVFAQCATTRGQLQKDFYTSSCPMVHDVINRIVTSHVMMDPTAALVQNSIERCNGQRQKFADDVLYEGAEMRGVTLPSSSVILLDASQIGNSVEKNSPSNIGLHGEEIVDEIKLALEELCPRTVSRADILMLAARDATALVGLPRCELATGRRDGLISLACCDAYVRTIASRIQKVKSTKEQEATSPLRHTST